MLKAAAVVAFAVSLSTVALAEPPAAEPATCAATFPARLADAKRAVAVYEDHLRRYKAARPAVEWFEANCHFLSELERAVRKERDLNAFVCRTQKGRPKGLTAELVLELQAMPPLGSFLADEWFGVDHRCLDEDSLQRVGLILGPDHGPIERLELLCWDDASERCDKAREAIAAARARR